ncbi:MAG: hypothetical protein AAF388_02440 [Bacteroidota bacterium]
MTTRFTFILLFLGQLTFSVSAQQTETFRLSLTPEKKATTSQFTEKNTVLVPNSDISVSGNLETVQRWVVSPDYVLENPTGETYLCRLEDRLEANMKIPVWINTKDESIQKVTTSENIKVLFQVIRF